MWLGKADPLDTLESTRADDPERSLLSEVLQAWAKDHGVGAGSDVPLSVIVDRAMKMQSTGGFDPTLEPVFPDLMLPSALRPGRWATQRSTSGSSAYGAGAARAGLSTASVSGTSQANVGEPRRGGLNGNDGYEGY